MIDSENYDFTVINLRSEHDKGRNEAKKTETKSTETLGPYLSERQWGQ
jgi:hypothetical protein